MRKPQIKKSEQNSFYIKGRGIPRGCKYCLKGTKVILFLNGICQKPDHCSWYCPISEERRGKEASYADEILILSKEDLLDEIEKINAKGISITGGEPLSEFNLEKTIDYIKYIRLKKGKRFHIHLYTNGINFNETIVNRLALMGLDEIRFHPAKENWANIKLALNKGISVGAEVPVIPNKNYLEQLEKFIIYLDNIGAEFINLNEFEFCFPNSQSLKQRGFQLKKGSIAAVNNSYESALNLIKNMSLKVSLKIHFCSIRTKDYYQLKNRYLRRAKSIKFPFEVITEEGLLIYAQIEGKQEDLKQLKQELFSKYKIRQGLILFNKKNLKLPFYIALNPDFLDILSTYDLKGYIVEMTPFRNLKYQQITEKTPIEEFKNEYEFD